MDGQRLISHAHALQSRIVVNPWPLNGFDQTHSLVKLRAVEAMSIFFFLNNASE